MRKFILLMLALGAIMIASSPTLTESHHNITLVPWGVKDSKAYAKQQLYVWYDKQVSCLNKLWGKESAWQPSAYNKVKVMGKNAGGIPQLLGLDPNSKPQYQIERGLDYIYNRYGTPCKAWQFFKRNGWH